MFLESAYTGMDVAELARPFDTVYVSLYKYFKRGLGSHPRRPRRAARRHVPHAGGCSAADSPPPGPSPRVALNFLPGFIERFTSAVGTSESFITEGGAARRFLGRADGGRAPTCSGSGWTAPTRRPSGSGFASSRWTWEVSRADGRFLIGVNETWNRATPDDLARRFRSALA